MEFITTSQLQKYEETIEQIKREFEKYDTLKNDLEKVNDNLILSQLANSKLTQKLSHLNVLVFDKFIDLVNLYGEELQSDFSDIVKHDYCKFYFIEIYITKSLMQKARGLRCMLHIYIKTENANINKTMILTSKLPIRAIVPVDKNNINSTVEASLVVPSEDKWMVIKLDTMLIDISFHFQVYKEKQKTESRARHILKITESYNKGLINQDLQKPLTLETKLFCDIEKDHFISAILKNSYHSLNLELFLELQHGENKEFHIKLCNGVNTCSITFNKRDKYLKLETNIHDLCLLKKYLYKEFYQETKVNAILGSDISKTLKMNGDIIRTPQEVCAFFSEVRECWSRLPI